MQTITDIKELKKAIKKYGIMIVSKNSDEDDNVNIMSIEEYEKLMLKEDVEKNLLEAEDDIKNGRVYDAEEVFEEWDEKYGI